MVNIELQPAVADGSEGIVWWVCDNHRLLFTRQVESLRNAYTKKPPSSA